MTTGNAPRLAPIVRRRARIAARIAFTAAAGPGGAGRDVVTDIRSVSPPRSLRADGTGRSARAVDSAPPATAP
nr:hypothetical protein GCM10020241_42590 [Streptoalloteichus tenebrarius]